MKFKLLKWLYMVLATYKYRMVDPDVCCCGSSNCDGDYSHGYVNAKDYAIKHFVKSKLDKQ